ncbi:TetR family transcriptional regulator [Streptomyces griseoloalbus]|uniref:AcrR family transcriptional regulator n=1 Tax=Streptomyces griseoloalbus TaxID=67303 RepID=A0A7W8BL54_9ACTN|nr:TetR family transcriptional regulator [Streptomyces albaduncus]MBB5124361.1 AcrR family transcriptional regulator [Streptomyces albaduncus]GGW64639.1 TetR family transcriptional regulator [Streptomyces albaduncus]
MSATPVGTREISRHAVRAELARVAFNRFCLTGFDQVTFADLSEAAGVSRSTFLRYFGTKEDVVLFVFDPVGDVIADALDADRANQDDWSRLRNALESAVTFLVRDVQELVTILGLVEQTPALCARLREKQAEWRPGIVARLRKTTSSTDGSSVIADVRVAAALECLWIVLGQWSASGGEEDLGELLDAAFAAFSTPACRQTHAPS